MPQSQSHPSRMEIFRLVPALMLFLLVPVSEGLACKKRRDAHNATSGDVVYLPCLFSWAGKDPSEYMVVWRLTGASQDVMVHGWEGHGNKTEQEARFRGRTGMTPDWFAEGNATLSVSKLAPDDGGLYTCQVTTMNPHTRMVCAELALSVHEGPGESDVGHPSGDQVVRQQHQNELSSTAAVNTEHEQTTGHNPGPGRRAEAKNRSSRSRSRLPLLIVPVPILLFLAIYAC